MQKYCFCWGSSCLCVMSLLYFIAWFGDRHNLVYIVVCMLWCRVCHWIFILPTLCDLTGTTLAGAYKLVLYRNVMYCFACSFYFKGIGLVIVNASVWQMLRGSIIVFTGILSVLFLKRKLKCFHWVGILLVVVQTFVI